MGSKSLVSAPTTLPKLLIVEDDANLRQLLVWHLEELNFAVMAAAGVARARQLLAKNSFQVVLTDFLLPDGNGLELLQYLATNAPEIKVFIMSGRTDSSLPGRSRMMGAIDFIPKPIDPQSLDNALCSAIQSM